MDDLRREAGLLALVGGGEFGPGNEAHDELLAGASHGQGFLVATAAARSRPERAVRQGILWFQQFGLELTELAVYTQKQAQSAALVEAAAHAGFFYLAGGDPGLVASLLRSSPVGAAILSAWRNGAVLAGSSAGAMVLCADTLVRQSFPSHTERRAVPGLGVIAHCAVLPHHDTFGHKWYQSARAALPEATLIGVDERTCALWHSGAWQCLGPGAVTVYAPGTDAAPYRRGEVEGLPQPSTRV